MTYIFLLLCTPGSFSLHARHLNFTLLDAGSFYILINILELCSVMQLSYLEIVQYFKRGLLYVEH